MKVCMRVMMLMAAMCLFVNAHAVQPRVVSTTPKNGDMNVDPNLKEIVIKFNVAMGKGYSFTGGGETHPPGNGKAYWRDDKTFVRPVNLEADHDYYFGVNSPSYRNFKSKDGVSVKWTKVNFKTRALKAGETLKQGADNQDKKQARKLPAPRVVKMTPRNGDMNVDPNLSEIVIEFNVPMSGGYSFTGGGDTHPPGDGKAYWRDEKTYVRPVHLEPDHKYYFGVNSPSHRNFKSVDGVSVRWVKVNFKTRKLKQGETRMEAGLPRIVSITPEIGAVDVDPKTTEIVVVFDQPMQKGYAFPQFGNDAPKGTSRPMWKDNKTIVWPVALEANKRYRFGVNWGKFNSFRNTEGKPVRDTMVTFRTGDGKTGISRAEAKAKKANAPKIVSISPSNGSMGVDPSTNEIVVKFDQPMEKGYAFPSFGDDSPEGIAKPEWKDEQTIVWKVKLKPNKAYRFGVNWGKFNTFRNKEGVPVRDTMVRFWTGDKK